jgi:dipeptidase E
VSGLGCDMKLLLTSGGITNPSIAAALADLAGKPAEGTKVGFIPTAANVEEGDKGWFIETLADLKKYGYWVDIVDISAPGVDWRGRLARGDVVLVNGGNTFHLLDQVRKTSFDTWLAQNLATKVYVGVSAGSILATPSIAVASVDGGDKNLAGIEDLSGLSLVPFEVSPHTPEVVSHKGNQEYRQTIANPLYEIDDQTAIKVVDGHIEVVSEGKWALL